jgi:putative transposase
MNEIITILGLLSPTLAPKTLKQLILICEAMLAMTGRVTMLGIARWTEKGGSYRTIQRFFKQQIDWGKLRWLLIKQHLTGIQGTYILAADEVVVTKSGQETHGLGIFFSSIYGKALPSLCFLGLSLIHVEAGQSYALLMEQLVRQNVQETAPKAVEKKKPGRPKGSKNKNHAQVELSPFLLQLQSCIRQVLTLINLHLKVTYFVYDGALGNNAALQMVKQTGLHLISKLRHDSKLFLPYQGDYQGKGRPRKYGDRLTLDNLPEDSLRKEKQEGDILTRIYQLPVWHELFPIQLNLVMIVKTNLKTGKTAKMLLFSDDLTLAYDLLIQYYSLRFQIEFDFRDSKQYWGLEDFMNIGETQVNNAANLSWFMVTFSRVILSKIPGVQRGSMLDLKTVFRARKITRRIINLLGINADEFLSDDSLFEAAEIGRIHAKAA